ncbi:MAG: 4-hydroxybutyrate CoA-transferase [Bernardetiaceae bacterium]|nr:4-hydroxybutyrate CoA-transferase [Bernardetiaceae bacterium]
MLKFVSAAKAVQCIAPGHRVFVHSAAMTPRPLVTAMVNRASELKDVEIIHIHTEDDAAYAQPQYRGVFNIRACFVGANLRRAVNDGNADYIPIFLSDIPSLFRKKIAPVDVALVQLSPPDRHGYCSLGVSVDVALAAVETARYVVALINPNVPRTHGEGFVHVSRLHAAVETDGPIFEIAPHALSEQERQIGKHVAGLVEDGATLQMGIGGIPDAVLAELGGHKKLGIHTEMFSDGIIDLVKKGVITGENKRNLRGKIVSGFSVGSRRLYDFIDDNPMVHFRDTAFTNDTFVIARNPKVTAINSAIEIDLSGQVCADTIGTMQFSGVGGQMDFVRGAALSEGGKPIIALPSITGKGESKIVTFLKPGAAVTTTRAHVHYIATEFGVAYLFGKSRRQRAKALIDIAHPDHRERLEREAFEWLKRVG